MDNSHGLTAGHTEAVGRTASKMVVEHTETKKESKGKECGPKERK